MKSEQAQALAPSYMALPDDGAPFRCSVCGKETRHDQMVVYFTPDKKVHMATCLECMDEEWMEKAKDCGVAE